MKILHLSSENTWRGGEQQIAYLLEEIEKKGIPPIVACKKGSAFEEYVKTKGWQYFTLPFKNSLDIKTAWHLKRICKEFKIEIVHLHASKSHGIATLSSTLGNPSKLILSRRVDFPLKQNLLSRWKYNHPAIKKIICVSDKIKEIIEAGINDKSKCITIHSGIDLSKFNPKAKTNYFRRKFNIPNTTKIIGNTSAIADHKDYFTFVDTAEILIKQDINLKFLIIGDGPLMGSVKDYVALKKLEDHVIFTGFINNIVEVLPELDVFLITSKTEGLGTSILDAFASKVPVVATNAGGIPEAVINENTGLLAPIKDYNTLADQVKRILTDQKLRASLIEKAHSYVQNFAKEQTAEKTLAVYREILGK